MERLARLCVGIGFLWAAIILIWGLAAGIDQPYAWYKWARDSSGWGWMEPTYLALALFIVPVGFVVFIKDILGDPVAAWVKWAAPGAFLAVYAFFLLMALPEVGGPLFGGIESVSAPVVTKPGVPPGRIGSNWDYALRFLVAFAVLAGIPGVVGAIVQAASGSKTGVRRH
jgi:hypothetical protein